jgi:hypothetical protein
MVATFKLRPPTEATFTRFSIARRCAAIARMCAAYDLFDDRRRILKRVARTSDSDMRGQAVGLFPDVAIAHPGYACLLFLILALGPQRTWALKELGPSKKEAAN